MALSEFYRNPENTVTREHMFTSRLQFELLEAAGRRGVALRAYIPTVDRDGFDIIFDDGQSLVPVQLKTNIANTSSWKVHRKLYRPKRVYMPAYHLHSPSYNSGMGGGVIVMNISVSSNNQTSVSYMYSDFLILHMLKEGFFEKSNLQLKVNDVYSSTIDEVDGKFSLNKCAFIEASNPDQLLNLMGLQSIYNSMWRMQYLDYIRDKNDPDFQSSWNDNLDEYKSVIKRALHKVGYTN